MIIDIKAYMGVIIFLGFSIIGNIFFLKESKEKAVIGSEVKKLKWIGMINIVSFVMNFIFPPIIPTDEVTTLYMFLVPIFLTDIPFFVGYGIIMYLFGKKVVHEWGNYLKIAGLVGIVGNSFLFTSHIILLITVGNPIVFYIIAMIFSTIGAFSWLSEYIIIYVSGKKNKLRNHTISGFILSLGFILYLLLEVILLSLVPVQF
ncbi:MAG: hypothetical protein EU533_03880 [Promethearchaeota archaeon]|nr:MAG: hypothetical protein EU533_03880 [Candidatus Lokiarchaeota archaeon]